MQITNGVITRTSAYLRKARRIYADLSPKERNNLIDKDFTTLVEGLLRRAGETCDRIHVSTVKSQIGRALSARKKANKKHSLVEDPDSEERQKIYTEVWKERMIKGAIWTARSCRRDHLLPSHDR